MATYLITGVAGFLGSHLAEALLAQGHSVRGLDNFATGQRENIPAGVHLIEADLADATAVAEACAGVQAILHHGARRFDPDNPCSGYDPRLAHRANVDGTFNVLEGARAAGVRRVIYAACGSACGNQPGLPRVETMLPAAPALWTAQKLAGELYMQSYARTFGMETVCLRYFNLFGPRDAGDSPHAGVIARWCPLMLRAGGRRADGQTRRPILQGSGAQTRDFTYVANAVYASLLALEAPAERVAGQVFNIASGERCSLLSVYTALARLTGYPFAPVHAARRATDLDHSLASIEAAREAIGYKPLIGLEDGLALTVAWHRARLETKCCC